MPFSGAKDGRHYWLTPKKLFDELNSEFHFNNDPCPFPKPEGYDGLIEDWGTSNYVNPPFGSVIGADGKKKGPTAWARKSILESEKGNDVILVFPVPKWLLMLITHPNFKQIRNLGDVKWCATEDGQPGKGIGQHIAMFELKGSKTNEVKNE